MGKCKYNHYKKKCKLDICCFDCTEICKITEERCFDENTYEESKIRRYPLTCDFYIKDK